MAERTNEHIRDSSNESSQFLRRNEVAFATTRDWRLFNVVLLGVTFLFVFTAFQTCSMVQVRYCVCYLMLNGVIPRTTVAM